MGSDDQQLKICFLPFLQPGHMIPLVDMARLFARHGVDSTIITTAANADTFQSSIDRDIASGYCIRTHIIPFPSAQVGLPEGIENFNTVTSPEMSSKLYYGLSLLQRTIEQFFEAMQPHCIVSDMFYPWTVDVAERLEIPRLIFDPSSCFAICAAYSVQTYELFKTVESDEEKFVLPGLPDKIEMTKMQLPDWVKTHTRYTDLMAMIKESEKRSYGNVSNSFAELEGAYVENYRSVMGINAWTLGPVSLWVNSDASDKVERGNKAHVDKHECLSWLDDKEPNSVLYVSFGSLTVFSDTQLMEMAHGLESSGHAFIWVVRRKKDEENVAWLPEGYKERMKESKQGLIIEGWAPQLLILDHPATGGLVTHCGWNSILEGIHSGLPLITWPKFAEQFYNERLIVDLVKVGVPVGVQAWCNLNEEAKELVKREKIAETVRFLMGKEEEAVEIRNRAVELGKLARNATKNGGSSEANLLALIDDLKSKSRLTNVS